MIQEAANFLISESPEIEAAKYEAQRESIQRMLAEGRAEQLRRDFQQAIESGDVDAAQALLTENPTFDLPNLVGVVCILALDHN
jgi:hypothetical protein